jgi:hypothetical protein
VLLHHLLRAHAPGVPQQRHVGVVETRPHLLLLQ